jgi:hypothetical protein
MTEILLASSSQIWFLNLVIFILVGPTHLSVEYLQRWSETLEGGVACLTLGKPVSIVKKDSRWHLGETSLRGLLTMPMTSQIRGLEFVTAPVASHGA